MIGERGAASTEAAVGPLWSVMIPVYHPDRTLLRETLESVFAARTGAAIQIALVRDFWPNPEPELDTFFEGWRKRGVEVYQSVGRLGLGGNWNRCIDLARGQIVHILHQDDRIHPGFYQAHETAFQSVPSLGASFTQHAFIDGEGRLIRYGHLDQKNAGILYDWYEYLVANFAVQCPAIVVKRSVYERLGGFDTSYRYAIDRAMWQRIAAEYPIWFDPRPLADYRMHNSSETAALRTSLVPMRETQRVIAEGLQLIPPTVRDLAMRTARLHVFGPAWERARHAFSGRKFQAAAISLIEMVAIARLSTYRAYVQKRYPRTPPARKRSFDDDGMPRRRIAVITEFFPGDVRRSVFGVFARLSRTIGALNEIADVDVVFFWPLLGLPDASQVSAWQQQVRTMWPSVHEIRFVPYGRRRRDLPFDLLWAIRLGVSFMDPQPTMRTTARAPVGALRDVLADLQPDLVFAHRIGAGAAFLRMRTPIPPLIVDIDDLEHIKIARLARSLPWGKGRLIKHLWAFLARRVTKEVGLFSKQLLVTSKLDQLKLQTLCPHSVVTVIPNTAAQLPGVQSVAATSRTAIFVGTFLYPPNLEGAKWIISAVWPLVLKEVPDAHLVIVGDAGERYLSNSKGIEIKGFVGDLAPIYSSARFAVCPIPRGAGTRIKIIEAAMNGRTSVATRIGAEGLDFEDQAEIILADLASDFAKACVALFLDPRSAEEMGHAARAKAAAVYDPVVVAKALNDACLPELATAAASSPRRVPPLSNAYK